MGVVFLILLLATMMLALVSMSMSVARGTFLWQNQSLKDRYFGSSAGYQSIMFWVSLCLIFGFVLGVIAVVVKILVSRYVG